MTGSRPTRALHLDLRPDPVFAVLHPAAQPTASTAVLICAPWGWEEVASHRARREWAQHLAGLGHAVLRFDLPGCGDSGGLPSDDGRVAAWAGAVTGCADWLRDRTDAPRVAAIGLGLGGLIAARALADGARIDDLVLWASPPRGRAFTRAQKAFSEMQGPRFSLDGDPGPDVLPDGWLEVNGFVLSKRTLDDISALDARKLATGSLSRALLLDQDGIAVDEALRNHLEKSGVEVTVAPGPGWGDLVHDPERPQAPTSVYPVLERWLADGTRAALEADDGGALPPADLSECRLTVGDIPIVESVLELDAAAGRVCGIVTLPAGADVPERPCVLFLNAGAVRRIGPNRMWTEAARRCAARGIPVARVDLEGIGESDGDGGHYAEVSAFYTQELVEQVAAAFDALQARGLAGRFVVVGLCSGGFWAFQAATQDPRVELAVVLNGGALVWVQGTELRRQTQKLGKLRQLVWWQRVLRGEVRREVIVDVLRASARSARELPRRGSPALGQARTPAERALDRLAATGAGVVIAFSGDEPLREELRRTHLLDRLVQWPTVRLRELPGRDHTLRPVVAQRAAHELLDDELGAL